MGHADLFGSHTNIFGDGQLSPAELKAIMCKEVPGGTARTEAEVDALVKQFDSDGDGMLSMEEIAGAWAAMAIKETGVAAAAVVEAAAPDAVATEGEVAAAAILKEDATQENSEEAPAVEPPAAEGEAAAAEPAAEAPAAEGEAAAEPAAEA